MLGLFFVNAKAEPSGFHLIFSTFSGVNLFQMKMSSRVNSFFCEKANAEQRQNAIKKFFIFDSLTFVARVFQFRL